MTKTRKVEVLFCEGVFGEGEKVKVTVEIDYSANGKEFIEKAKETVCNEKKEVLGDGKQYFVSRICLYDREKEEFGMWLDLNEHNLSFLDSFLTNALSEEKLKATLLDIVVPVLPDAPIAPKIDPVLSDAVVFESPSVPQGVARKSWLADELSLPLIKPITVYVLDLEKVVEKSRNFLDSLYDRMHNKFCEDQKVVFKKINDISRFENVKLTDIVVIFVSFSKSFDIVTGSIIRGAQKVARTTIIALFSEEEHNCDIENSIPEQKISEGLGFLATSNVFPHINFSFSNELSGYVTFFVGKNRGEEGLFEFLKKKIDVYKDYNSKLLGNLQISPQFSEIVSFFKKQPKGLGDFNVIVLSVEDYEAELLADTLRKCDQFGDQFKKFDVTINIKSAVIGSEMKNSDEGNENFVFVVLLPEHYVSCFAFFQKEIVKLKDRKNSQVIAINCKPFDYSRMLFNYPSFDKNDGFYFIHSLSLFDIVVCLGSVILSFVKLQFLGDKSFCEFLKEKAEMIYFLATKSLRAENDFFSKIFPINAFKKINCDRPSKICFNETKNEHCETCGDKYVNVVKRNSKFLEDWFKVIFVAENRYWMCISSEESLFITEFFDEEKHLEPQQNPLREVVDAEPIPSKVSNQRGFLFGLIKPSKRNNTE